MCVWGGGVCGEGGFSVREGEGGCSPPHPTRGSATQGHGPITDHDPVVHHISEFLNGGRRATVSRA